MMQRLMIFVFMTMFWHAAQATLPVQAPTTSTKTPPAPTVCDTTADSPPTTTGNLFGVSQRLPLLQQLRGGAVLEPSSLPDMESIIIRAGSEGKLIVVDFTATWCGPCKMIAPLFQELSEKLGDVVFVKVDVDENPDTAAKYNVSAMPTFLFIKDGAVVDRLMGANPARLEELLQEYK
mmetsp:Transcript_15318/g.19977  ORF Transcript_15318/g.19977 Transcript_15318/m.19977 type:complete len:178 (-) Transcript_15318:357-890(-)|eukprot:CAMPEP_0198143348 /NCGR_PEP_ID=MMETSP1443-20131203/6606_1 /TAXON_ID=186043 /ORGANISM="Entomoneis sp., Strain CCMP2396" /LENGTH=177 /DNA_ID=CAMNT_0043806573 /DNA_START=128 /DNA_END=664 /DNA_ORIENTATION=-